MNRLSTEQSPYLLQHAQNPVDWFPWGAEAFRRAEEENRPIFLSIGYSTCHWCHVMAHESFEDPEVARVLNRSFVAVKVDREERPDVDAVYMAVCQAVTGSGGWPLTILMTPQQKPFWAGTYLPKRGAYGRPGLLELLEAVEKQWRVGREELAASGEELAAFLRRQAAAVTGEAEPDRGLLREGADQLARAYDPTWGGFGRAPKFPSPHNLLFLLNHSVLTEDSSAREMAEHTLVRMYRGGLFDHIGGGFSRYSTDDRWLVPHFEKMLYDNALLALAYLEAWRLGGRPLFQRIARRTLDYVLRELTHERGGFFCGQDADSDGVEGKYYVFTPREVRQVLGEDRGEAFCRWFGITQEGNFEGKSIPNLIGNPRFEEDEPEREEDCRALYDYRLRRTRLHRDDKVLTAWSALMTAALARAGRLLGEPRYLAAAERARDFLEDHLTDGRGRLLRRWRAGQAGHAGQLDDYAFYALALLELYRATLEVRYLSRAVLLARQMLEWFPDREGGGFYLCPEDGETLISRPKEVWDGALPSGNSAAAEVLVRLAALTGEETWRRAAHRQLGFVSEALKKYPAGGALALLALSRVLWPSRELLCVTAGGDAPPELTALLGENLRPNLSVLLKTPGNAAELVRAAPFTDAYPLPPSGTLYYLCRDGACAAPAQSLDALRTELLLPS